MAKAVALAQLKDIHLPSPVGWWPLAPGWWIVVVVLFIGMMWMVWWCWRFWQAAQPKRQALRILSDIEQQAKDGVNANEVCAQISQLLRRVALTYYPNGTVAGLKDDDWIAFLNQHSRNLNFNAVREHLLVYPYQPEARVVMKPFFDRSRAWIKQRRRPCSN
jgi:hypothetical protein